MNIEIVSFRVVFFLQLFSLFLFEILYYAGKWKTTTKKATE